MLFSTDCPLEISGPLQVQILSEECFWAYAQHIVLFSNSNASVYILDGRKPACAGPPSTPIGVGTGG